MKKKTPEARFRQAAESVGNMPISAGARIVHVRTAVASGRAFYVDLSSVPDDRRPAVIADIHHLVNEAGKATASKSKAPRRRAKAS